MSTLPNLLNRSPRPDRPGLLISVRNVAEALAALAGGADVIDVKEPDRGSLGPADPATIAAVIRAVRGRAPVTAAMGELIDLDISQTKTLPDGVALFKIGLAGCRETANWQSHWRDAVGALSGGDAQVASRPVAVVYADWPAANAPPPHRVLNSAVELGCPVVLIDTWDKSTGSLFDHWPAEELSAFTQAARSHGLAVVLAGSLIGKHLAAAARLRPDLLAVRAAACDDGRNGAVSSERVRALRQTIGPPRPISSGKNFS